MIPLHGNPVRIIKTGHLTTIRSRPVGQNLHDSVLLRGRENSKKQELKLIRTKEEKETPFLIYSLNRKQQVDSKNHLLRATAQTQRHTKI